MKISIIKTIRNITMIFLMLSSFWYSYISFIEAVFYDLKFNWTLLLCLIFSVITYIGVMLYDAYDYYRNIKDL